MTAIDNLARILCQISRLSARSIKFHGRECFVGNILLLDRYKTSCYNTYDAVRHMYLIIIQQRHCKMPFLYGG